MQTNDRTSLTCCQCVAQSLVHHGQKPTLFDRLFIRCLLPISLHLLSVLPCNTCQVSAFVKVEKVYTSIYVLTWKDSLCRTDRGYISGLS